MLMAVPPDSVGNRFISFHMTFWSFYGMLQPGQVLALLAVQLH